MPAPRKPVPLPDSDAALARYSQARAEAIAQFVRSNRVESLWHGLTAATDALIAALVQDAAVTLVAVGGYGRGELFPYSDVDVLVLLPEGAAPDSEQQTVQLLQRLWDMQVPVSHATRTLEETITAAVGDHTIAASLLEARHIAGDARAFRTLKKRLKQEVIGVDTPRFIAAKLADRERRHSKWGDSRLMLEPNIKEGKGALRDLQTLRWIASYHSPFLLSTEEWRQHRQASLFFSTVRAHMHAIRARADERLTFDLQKEIALRLKFRGRTGQEKAERFMRRYFQFTRLVSTLTRILCAGLEEANLRPVSPTHPAGKTAIALPDALFLDGGRLMFRAPEHLPTTPTDAVALFTSASAGGFDIHPRAYLALDRALPTIRHRLMFEGEAHRLFLEMLLTSPVPETHLRRMNESGILGALIPEFERITGMMQYDGYHTYTVDEHMLVAVGNLVQIEQGAWADEVPLASKIVHEITARAPLYLATLCHDIAKGTGGGHAEKGEVLMLRIATRMGLSAPEAELAAWLVKYQSLLTEIAFKRDLDDPSTIADFAAIVGTPDRLRLLLLLTVSDVKAVGPTIWNGWKGALLRELYRRAMGAMGVSVTLEGAATAPSLIVPSESLSEAASAARAQWEQDPHRPAIIISHDTFRAVTEITCCMAYHPTLFRTLAGVMASIGASIVTARMVQQTEGSTLTTLAIQDVHGKSFVDDAARLSSLAERITQASAGNFDLAAAVSARRVVSAARNVMIPIVVSLDNEASADATVIEIQARDRLGLLYDLLAGFEECGLDVLSAQLATYGRKAVDVFYVQDRSGEKLRDMPAHARITRVLLDSANGLALDYTI